MTNNEKQVGVVTTETTTKNKEIEHVAFDYVRVAGRLSNANEEVKTIKERKKLAEAFLIENLEKPVIHHDLKFEVVPEHTKSTVETGIDKDALVEYLQKNASDVLKKFDKQRIVTKTIPTKLSVKKATKQDYKLYGGN